MQGNNILQRKQLLVDTPALSPALSDMQNRKHQNVATGAGPIAISIHRNIQEIEHIWRAFEESGICSLYQRYDWCANWLKSAGLAQGGKPYIVLGKVDDKPAFLFPLVKISQGPFQIASWIGGTHSNFNMAIYEQKFIKSVCRDEMQAIFEQIVCQAADIDAFELSCQPEYWRGHKNPMGFLKHLPSPDHAYSLALAATFDEVLAAHNGKKKRKKYRSQMRALEPLGGPKLIVAETPDEIDRLLDAALAQINLRLERLGVANVFAEEGVRDFFYDLAISSIGNDEPSLVIYGLEVDDKIRATFSGGGHNGRFSGCFTSIAMDELSHTSPGDLLLYLVIEDCIKRGYISFDLGRGYERYKSSWCDEVEPMFESFIPVSRKARLLGGYNRIKVVGKRTIKQNPRLWNLAKQVRAKFG